MTTPALFSALTLRGVTLPNRLVVAPMCQYSVTDGLVGDYHLAHLGRFALGGFGLVVVEATGVTPEGRISHGDVGLWSDEHVAGLARIVDFLHAEGSVAGIQLAHAGAKASSQRPWDGGGPVTPENARPGDNPWLTVSASAVPAGPGWPVPHGLTVAELAEVRDAFVAATLRSIAAGFDVVEVHAAHGYLLHQFLSPLSNRRTDAYGGSFDNRVRLPLEVVDAVRAAWPDDKPVLVRLSASDWVDEGWSLEETADLAALLRDRGVDLVDVSSGGLDPAQQITVGPGYQVPFARHVREKSGVPIGAVGLITQTHQAEEILADGSADVVLLAREALRDPSWPLRAAAELEPASVRNLYPVPYLRASPAPAGR